MIARRIVTISIATLAVSVAAATLVGFWLSYAGLHDFAVRNGLSGAEAWAWPCATDLFILAGELGITISAIRHRKDHAAWVYLALGFGASVAFNILHVKPIQPGWGPYAVAAVPPIAAMLALAALMRQVYRLAIDTGKPPDLDLAKLAQDLAQEYPEPEPEPEVGTDLPDWLNGGGGKHAVDPDATVTFDVIPDVGDATPRGRQ